MAVSSSLVLLGIAAAVIGTTLALMLLDRTTARLATRNMRRRKATMALVVLGLMMGAAMVSGSLTLGDTSGALLVRNAYANLGNVDEEVYHSTPSAAHSFFGYAVYGGLRSAIFDNRSVVGVTPEVVAFVSAFDRETGVAQPRVALIGVDPNATSVLGQFVDGEGRPFEQQAGQGGVILNFQAARDMNASVGDPIEIFYNGTGTTLTVNGIDHSFLRSGFPDGVDHAVVTLETAQSIMSTPGQINLIAVTNAGGQQSVSYTSEVGSKANSSLAALRGGAQLAAYGTKNATLATANKSSQGVSMLFVSISAYVIGTGIILVRCN